MPVDVLLLPGSSISTKWKEPYASASINQKLAGIIAPGIYRGLLIAEDPLAGDRTVVVQADPTRGDHVAVYENDSGYSVTYRDISSGDITLSLSSYASVTVIVSVFIDYIPGSNTTGSFRVFTQAEYNALSTSVRDALVVLGTVNVPVSGAIASSSISLLNRTVASSSLPTGSIPNAPVVRNPGFDLGETNGTYQKSSIFWDKTVTVGTGSWKTSTLDVDTGLKSIELNVLSMPLTGELSQQIGIPVLEDDLFRASVRIKQLKTVSSGTLAFFMEWADANDAVLSANTASLDGGAIDSSFRTVEVIFKAPAGAVSLRTVGIRATAFSPSGTGIFGYIDNVGVFALPADTIYPYPFDQAARRALASRGVLIGDPAGDFSSLAAHLSFDASTPSGEGTLKVERRDQAAASVQPAVSMGGRILGLGSSLIGSETNSLKARVTAPASVFGGVEYTLMWESVPSGERGYRKYVTPTGQLVETVNARWDGANWNKDVSGQAASMVLFESTGVSVLGRLAANNTAWVGWDTQPAGFITAPTSNVQLSATTVGSTLQVNGTTALNDHLTMATDKHVTVQGLGKYKRPSRIRVYDALSAELVSLYPSTYNRDLIDFFAGSSLLFWQQSGQEFRLPIVLDDGERLTEVRAYTVCGVGDQVRLKLWRSTITVGNTLAGTTTQVGSTQTSSNTTGIVEQLTISGISEDATVTGATGLKSWSVELENPAFAGGPICAGIAIFTTVP